MKQALLLQAAGLFLLVGCRTSEEVVVLDEMFGHRFEHRDPEERSVLALVLPPEGVDYFTYPVVLTGMSLRMGPLTPGLGRLVEIVFLGALPDACTELYGVEERRRGHMIEMTFEMWRPKGAACAQVTRPYRFYYELSESLPPGSYSLHLNDAVEPFHVPFAMDDEDG